MNWNSYKLNSLGFVNSYQTLLKKGDQFTNH